MNGTGAGVNVTNVDRVVDEFLIREIRDQQAIIGNLDVREEFLSQLEALFASPENNRSITNALGEVRDSLEAFSVTPESSAAAFNAVNELRKMVLQIQELSTNIQTSLRLIRRSAFTNNINNELNINRPNGRAARAEVLNQPADESDECDCAVNRSQMDIRVIEDRRVC